MPGIPLGLHIFGMLCNQRTLVLLENLNMHRKNTRLLISSIKPHKSPNCNFQTSKRDKNKTCLGPRLQPDRSLSRFLNELPRFLLPLPWVCPPLSRASLFAPLNLHSIKILLLSKTRRKKHSIGNNVFLR